MEVCRRLPHLHDAFAQGEVSWAQMRTVVLQVHRLPRSVDGALDTAISKAITDTAEHDPDGLGDVVRWIVDDLLTNPAPSPPPSEDVLVLQPRLDGSGGRAFGDFGAVGFAALDAATEPGPPDLDGDGRPDPTSTATGRAARLTELCLTRGAPHARNVPDDASTDGVSAGAQVTVLLRAELSTLLGDDEQVATLLTHTTGGAMWTDAATARQLADRATRVRLVVTRDGAPVGVGRARRVAPGWLRDTTLALHDTCAYPGCQTAARVSDTDHAQPWDAGGPTDVANLAPLCGTHNHRKESDGWRVAQTADGQRTWVHPRTGLRIRTAPRSWRPPPLHRSDRNDSAGAPRGRGRRSRPAPPRDPPAL